MLLITPEYAALREERAKQTIDWLTGNFALKPIKQPVIARLRLSTTDAPKPGKARRRKPARA